MATGVTRAMVLPSAFVERSVQVETPDAFELVHAVGVFSVPVALKVGTVATIGLLKASSKVTVMSAKSTPSARFGEVPAMVEVVADTGPALKVTLPPNFVTGVAIERAFTSALVEDNVQVETPLALLAEQAPLTFVVPVFVAENVGVTPATGLLRPSLKLIVTVEVATPLAMTGPVPAMVEFNAEAPPDWNTTVPPVFATGATIARVFVSATIEASVQVETPLALLTEQPPSVFPVPVAEKVGVVPLMLLLKTSRRVMVIVEVDVPSAAIGPLPVMSELVALAAPGLKVTVPPVFTNGVAMASVFTSALVERTVQVDTPDALLTPHAVCVLPVPVVVNVGVWPATGLLFTSRRVTLTVEVATLSATTGLVPVIVEVAATAAPEVNVTVPPVTDVGTVMLRVFTSAVVDCIKQVETPLALPTLQSS